MELYQPEGEPDEIGKKFVIPATVGAALIAMAERDQRQDDLLGRGEEDDG